MEAPEPRPIHSIPARFAFGGDPDHQPVPGFITSVHLSNVLTALVTGEPLAVTIDDPAFADALSRPDVCRNAQQQPLVLVNTYYRLLGLAVGPDTPPQRLAVNYGLQRLENGSVVEIPGADDQPGWLVFRCTVG